MPDKLTKRDSNRTILGIAALAHDPAASLFVDGKLVAAAEEEKISRVKNTDAFPFGAIRYVLKHAGIGLCDVDAIAYYWDDRSSLIPSLVRTLGYLPSHPSGIATLLLNRFRSFFSPGLLRTELLKLANGEKRKLPPIHYINHHEAHIASAIASAPFQPEAGLVMDGRGEYAATSLYKISNSERGYSLNLLKNYSFPNSLGVFYGAITQLLGEQAMSDEYKIMGLASYGSDGAGEWRRRLNSFLKLEEGGGYRLNIGLLNPGHCSTPHFPWLNERGASHFKGEFRDENSRFTRNACEFAFAAQELLTEAMEGLLRKVSEKTGARKVVMAGGVVMNASSVGHLRSRKIVDELHIPLAPADSGAAIGAALSCLNRFGEAVRQSADLLNPLLGPSFTEEEIEEALRHSLWSYERLANPGSEAARDLLEGKVLGWFEGRMEFGARALGARSILGDPRNPEMRDIINRAVKKREGYRPFAPSILEEECPAYFKTEKSRLMGEIVEATPLAAEKVPSVVHVNGTARPQTVPAGWPNRHFRNLIEEFFRLSGVPMVINTSFNMKGEPIVCTPDDAIRCFAVTGIDALYLPPFRIRKK